MKTEQLTTIEKLNRFVNSRGHFNPRDYFESWNDKNGVQAFRQDYSLFLKQGKIYRELLKACINRVDDLNTKLTIKLENSNDRLSLVNGKLQYITGQHYPVEFRGAACRVLWQILWEDYMNECEPGTNKLIYETGPEIRKAIERRVGKTVVNFMY